MMIRSVVDQFSFDKFEVIARRFITCWTDRCLYTVVVVDPGFYQSTTGRARTPLLEALQNRKSSNTQ